MTYQDIIFSKDRGVAKITINRPQVLNAFTEDTINEIYDAILDAAEDQTIGVVIITGAGDRAFCSGGDVKWERATRVQYSRLPSVDMREAMRKCPKPIIAAVKGYAIGGGNWLAYFADLTIAADNAIFGQNGARVGSPAAGYQISYLARVIGEKRAREMWYLCRRYTAQQAYEWGLVNWVVPLDSFDEEVDRIAQELLAKSPTVLMLLKTSFDQATDYLRSYSETFVQRMLAPEFPGSEESREGADAFLEKREPDFSRFRSASSHAGSAAG
jgi:dihydroxynaphthoic acid synthetase